MEEPKLPTTDEFERNLPDAWIKKLQAVHVALGIGVLTFGAVVVAYTFSTPTQTPQKVTLVWTMTLIHLGLSMLMFFGSFWSYHRLLSPSYLKKRFGPGFIDSAGLLKAIKSATVVRVALMETAAILGLVVCMVAATHGLLIQHPVFWINVISAVAMLFFLVRSFPTRDQLMTVFEANILVRFDIG